jgi:hypothetical protein
LSLTAAAIDGGPDSDWMLSTFKLSPSSPPTREEELVFVMTKDIRVMTGSLRPVADKSEVIFRADGFTEIQRCH